MQTRFPCRGAGNQWGISAPRTKGRGRLSVRYTESRGEFSFPSRFALTCLQRGGYGKCGHIGIHHRLPGREIGRWIPPPLAAMRITVATACPENQQFIDQQRGTLSPTRPSPDDPAMKKFRAVESGNWGSKLILRDLFRVGIKL